MTKSLLIYIHCSLSRIVHFNKSLQFFFFKIDSFSLTNDARKKQEKKLAEVMMKGITTIEHNKKYETRLRWDIFIYVMMCSHEKEWMKYIREIEELTVSFQGWNDWVFEASREYIRCLYILDVKFPESGPKLLTKIQNLIF